jgi:CTP:molybdopterin cytidylyltransferase MocA
MIGIVLAAGRGTRVGGPKAMLDFLGEPLARAHAARLLGAGCREVIVALPESHADAVTLPHGARVAISNAPDQAGSLAVALGAVTDVDAQEIFLVTPVDVVPTKIETLQTLAEKISAGEFVAATPTFLGKHGHPIAIRSSALETTRTISPTPTMHETLEKCGNSRARVEVDDEAVLSEINLPTDAIRWLGHISFH